MAGGFTDKAARSSLTITRRIANLDNTVSAQLNTLLLPDDTLVVGPLQKFFMMGEVSNPGYYTYEEHAVCEQGDFARRWVHRESGQAGPQSYPVDRCGCIDAPDLSG